MKSLNVIKAIIPMLSAIQQRGSFSNPIIPLARNWVEELANTGIEDKIDLTDALMALEAIANATDFETQQDEMVTALALLDQLLEDIPAGKVPAFVAPRESFTSIRLRLVNDIGSILDVMRPAPAILEKMRNDAANMAAVAMAEPLPAEHRLVPDQVYDLIDRSVHVDFHERRSNLMQARNELNKIAV